MINKKGEEARPSGAIVLALIAAFVLIVVYLFLFGPFRSILENAGFLIPTLNASQPLAENIQLLRYDISEDEVKYYDGAKWHLFGADVVKLGDKKLSETTLLEDFKDNHYYDRLIPKTFQLEKNWNPTTPDPEDQNRIRPTTYKREISVQSFNDNTKGEAFIFTQILRTTLVPTYFKLTLDNKLEMQTTEIKDAPIGETKKTDSKTEIVTSSYINNKGTSYQFPTEIQKHIDSLEGLELPFNKEDFNQNSLDDNLISLNIDSEITLNENYKFKSFEKNPKTASYQLYFQENPIDIKLVINELSVGEEEVKVLTIILYAKEISNANYKTFQYISEPEKEIIQKVSEWRDSILEKPITINYNDDESNTYCVEKFDNKYLVVNLKEPKTEC